MIIKARDLRNGDIYVPIISNEVLCVSIILDAAIIDRDQFDDDYIKLDFGSKEEMVEMKDVPIGGMFYIHEALNACATVISVKTSKEDSRDSKSRVYFLGMPKKAEKKHFDDLKKGDIFYTASDSKDVGVFYKAVDDIPKTSENSSDAEVIVCKLDFVPDVEEGKIEEVSM